MTQAAPKTKTLVRNIGHLVTMDADRRVLRGAWLLAEDGIIRSVGTGAAPRVRGSGLFRAIALPRLCAC